ncbi:MAG: hypothetical protein VX642_13425 [Bdellovibrionota bacterium]|nr:hypothetical protein [Bdellovibrionota bacterium]
MSLWVKFLKLQSYSASFALILFLLNFDLRASTCNKSAINSSSNSKVEIMGDGKVNLEKFEEAMVYSVEERELEYWTLENESRTGFKSATERTQELAEARDRIDSEAAEAFLHLGVILEKSKRSIGFPERSVFHVSTQGNHYLNKMAKSLSEDLYGLKIRVVKDLEGSTRATYSGAFNEMTLPLNLLRKFTVTNRTIGHELIHAINHLFGTSNFGRIGVLESSSNLPGRKGKPHEKNISLDEFEAHFFSFLSLLAEYYASLKGVDANGSTIILDKDKIKLNLNDIKEKITVDDIYSKAKFLNGLSDTFLSIAPAMLANSSAGSLKITGKAKGGRNPLFFDDPEILAYASMNFNFEGTEFYYKVPIYKEDMRELIMGQQTNSPMAIAHKLAMRPSEEMFESQYKIIAEQKIEDFVEFIFSMEMLMPQVLKTARKIDEAKNKVKVMDKLVHTPDFSRMARTGITNTELIDLFAKLALPGEDYLRYWGIEQID